MCIVPGQYTHQHFTESRDHFTILKSIYLVDVFLSELVGPWQDVEGTGCGGDRDVAAEEEVLLLRPERGLQRPRPAQPALCTGTQTTLIDLATLSGFPDFVH